MCTSPFRLHPSYSGDLPPGGPALLPSLPPDPRHQRPCSAAGELVVKVFFPRESGLDPEGDFQNEGAVCRLLTQRQVPVPGFWRRAAWRTGTPSPTWSPSSALGRSWASGCPGRGRGKSSPSPGSCFGFWNRSTRRFPALLAPLDLRRRALENFRLEHIPASLARELTRRAERADLSRPVLVHGDLTGENVLVSSQGAPVLLDWADACLAPPWYELPPLVFGPLGADPALLAPWMDQGLEPFLEQVLDGLALHDFGPDILREAAQAAGRPPFTTLEEVRNYLGNKLG